VHLEHAFTGAYADATTSLRGAYASLPIQVFEVYTSHTAQRLSPSISRYHPSQVPLKLFLTASKLVAKDAKPYEKVPHSYILAEFMRLAPL
jgi:hypothetical protein